MPSAILLLMFVAAAAANTDYCDISTCGNATEQHTMCQYSSTGAAASCGEVRERGLSDADQQEILDAHNTIRQSVKAGIYADNNLPAAKSMPDLTWDSELAIVAQRWTDQCVFDHDICRDVPSFWVGQNMGWKAGGNKNWTGAVRRWFDNELSAFTQQNLAYGSGQGGTGHLTQVIWAATNTIGCGFIGVRDTTTFPGYDLTARTYICNYGPAGNVGGQNIYEEKQDGDL